jgi:DNA-directed RNA polymerase specialized sigma24 family protein
VSRRGRTDRRERKPGERSQRQRLSTLRLFVMGYSLREIAAATGISEKAVRRRLRTMGVIVV